jgi:hypothetical protein
VEPPVPIEVTGELEYEVQEILASKICSKKLLYRASWAGYDPDPEWYPASNFKYSPHLLQAFYTKYPKAAGPPKKLPDWLTAYNAGLDEYEHLNSNAIQTIGAIATRKGGGNVTVPA